MCQPCCIRARLGLFRRDTEAEFRQYIRRRLGVEAVLAVADRKKKEWIRERGLKDCLHKLVNNQTGKSCTIYPLAVHGHTEITHYTNFFVESPIILWLIQNIIHVKVFIYLVS